MLGSRSAAVAAAGAAARRAASRAMSGVVAGQDTPVAHAANLPDHIKKEFTSATEHPEGFDEEEPAAGCSTGEGAGQRAQKGQHPGPAQDPYSGGDPSQQELAQGQPAGS